MKIKLLNPTRSFSQGVATVSMEVRVQDDVGTVLYSEGISASNGVGNPDFKEHLAKMLLQQILTIQNTYDGVMIIINKVYPTSKSPDDALLMLTAELEAAANTVK